MLVTYLRAGVAALPLAGRLPLLPGGGGPVPPLQRSRDGVAIDRGHLARYRELCSFTGEGVPATYPHLLAFADQMAILTDGQMPFGPIGLVHLRNAISQHRAIDPSERLDLEVVAADGPPHRAGRLVELRTTARIDGELVWEETSTMLRRSDGDPSAPREARDERPLDGAPETWELADDLGRRYAGVSGDRNPIHLHPLTAKAFGFPRAIAHGMWTTARALAALQPPDACTVEVAFRKPILLPASVALVADGDRFAVRDAGRPDVVHLDGTVTTTTTKKGRGRR